MLKLSGETFGGKGQFGLDVDATNYIASEVKAITDMGCEVGIVVGGGNFIRGEKLSRIGIDRVTADYMGMLGTMINALALQSILEKLGSYTRVMSSITALEVSEPFIRRRAVRHLEKSKKDSAGQFLYYFLIDSKLFEILSSSNSIGEERRVQNIAKFFDRIKSFETERPDANIFILYEWLNLMLQMGDSPTAADVDIKDKNVVNILTVHSSKGLEFKVVFMVNLVSDRFPSRERSEKIPLPDGILKENILSESDFHLEEERRLFYVGVTRAKERLYFTAADYYGTGKRIRKLSPFIYDALPNLLEEKLESKTQQLSLPEVLSVYREETAGQEEKPPLKISYVTFSNLQMFDICPLHYKAKVIFNLPTPPAAVQSFGISIHNTLYNFYKQISERATPSLKQLLKIFKEEWMSEGYSGKRHEEERFAQGIKLLEEFYKTSQSANSLFFTSSSDFFKDSINSGSLANSNDSILSLIS